MSVLVVRRAGENDFTRNKSIVCELDFCRDWYLVKRTMQTLMDDGRSIIPSFREN